MITTQYRIVYENSIWYIQYYQRYQWKILGFTLYRYRWSYIPIPFYEDITGEHCAEAYNYTVNTKTCLLSKESLLSYFRIRYKNIDNYFEWYRSMQMKLYEEGRKAAVTY